MLLINNTPLKAAGHTHIIQHPVKNIIHEHDTDTDRSLSESGMSLREKGSAGILYNPIILILIVQKTR